MVLLNSFIKKTEPELEFHEAASWGEYFRNVPEKLVKKYGIFLHQIAGATATVAAGLDILAFNRIVGLGLTRPVDEAIIDDVINLYKEAGVKRFFIQISPDAKPDTLPDLLDDKGFVYHNNWVKLKRDIAPLPESETSLQISRIDAPDADIYADIIVRSFEWPDTLRDLIRLPVGRPGWRHYLAFDGTKPAACAALYMNGRMASLAFAATLPEYRGRGAQSALITKRFADAAANGCRTMISETAEEYPERPVASFRNMIRHGFEVAYKRPNFLYVFE